MAFTEREKKKLQELISSMSEDDLASFVAEQSQTRTFNPDVLQEQSGGSEYLMGTRGGRERYAADKEKAEERLNALSEMVKLEGQKRSNIRQGEIDRGENMQSAPAGSVLEVIDDPTEYEMSMTEAVEQRLAKQQAVADSDTSQLQRDLGGIDPEAMSAARSDRDKAAQKSLDRKMRNIRVEEAKAQKEEESMAAAAESDRDKATKKSLKRELRNTRARARATRKDKEAAEKKAESDYESRQGAEQEAAEKADASFKEPTLRAEPVPEMDEKEAGRLFKMIMGSSFDPVSSMDKGKMEILKRAKAENPDLTDNQLALKIYRDYM